MPTAEETRITDAAELQSVLTRYVDSYDGYTEAASVVESPGLAAAFLEIAARRKIIVEHVAALIVKQGEKPDSTGSVEATLHRCWIRFRAQMTEEEFKATLAECLRGEQELARTIQEALDGGLLENNHAAILAEVATELQEALKTFKTALNR